MALFLALALAASEPATVRLNASQALAAAAYFEKSGDNRTALRLLSGLEHDPSPRVRAEALARRAAIVTQSGGKAEAAVLLRRAVDTLPRSGPLRLRLAQILDSQGDIDGARRQVRAAQAIGLPPDIARKIGRYAGSLRTRAPYGWSVGIAIAPDSNINRATALDHVGTVIGDFTIDGASRSKSGIGLATDLSAFGRVTLAEGLRWQLRGAVHSDRYSDQAFNRTNATIAIGPEFNWGQTQVGITASIQPQWLGGKIVQSVRAIGADAYRPVGRRTAVSTALSLASVDNRLNDLQDGRLAGASIAVDRALSSTAGLRLSLSGARFAASDPGYSTRSVDLGLAGWLDLGRETLFASGGIGRLRADERLALFPERRRDHSYRASVGITSRRIELLGFSPFARLNIERNASTIEIWDTKRRRLEFGVSRAY